jgi:hypothetical protein
MDEHSRDYLKFQYEQGADFIKHWHAGRHQLLTFVGTYTGAVLGASALLVSTESFAITDNTRYIAVGVCFVSALVALMGWATEYATASYSTYYFQVLCDIEAILNKSIDDEQQTESVILGNVGVATNGRRLREPSKNRGRVNLVSWWVHKIFPVQGVHKFFYLALFLAWIVVALVLLIVIKPTP